MPKEEKFLRVHIQERGIVYKLRRKSENASDAL
jgi:hypothetical protein